MENMGSIVVGEKRLPVQREGRQVYLSGCPVEQYPRKVREAVGEFVSGIRSVSGARVGISPVDDPGMPPV
jgi:hypothetical protein